MAMLVVMAIPAFAANPKASLQGEFVSEQKGGTGDVASELCPSGDCGEVSSADGKANTGQDKRP